MTLVGLLVACGGTSGTGVGTSSSGGSSSGGSSSGGVSSSGSSSGSTSGSTSSSGGLVYTTSCSPAMGDHFFDGAQAGPASSLGRVAAPCPTGMHGLATGDVLSPTGPLPPTSRFTSADSFAKAYCASGDNGTNGAAVDYATQDVIAVPYRGATSTPPTTLIIAGDVWLRTDENQCEGMNAGVQNQLAFYVVTKGQELSLETCVSTCGCIGENCERAPGD